MVKKEDQWFNLNKVYASRRHSCKQQDMIDISDHIYDGEKFTIKMCTICERVHITVHQPDGSDDMVDMKETPVDFITALDLDDMDADNLKVLATRYSDDLKQTNFMWDYKKSRFWFVSTCMALVLLIVNWFFVTFRGMKGDLTIIFAAYIFGIIVSTLHLIIMLTLKDYIRKKGVASPYPVSIIVRSDGKIKITSSEKDMLYQADYQPIRTENS